MLKQIFFGTHFPCVRTCLQARDVHSRALETGPGRVHPFSGSSRLLRLGSTCHTRLCCFAGKQEKKIKFEGFEAFNSAFSALVTSSHLYAGSRGSLLRSLSLLSELR